MNIARRLALLIALALCLHACPALASEEVRLPAAQEITVNGLTLAVDPRLELLSILQYVSKDSINARYGLMSNVYTQYKNDIDNHFRQFDEHPAIAYFDTETIDASERGTYGFDEPVGLILLMRDDFTLDASAFAYHQATYGNLNWNTPEKAQAFFDLLRDFCQDTGFLSFYDAQTAFYQTILSNTAQVLPEDDLIGQMEDFFGKQADGYTVNLVTLFHSGGFGGETNGDDGLFIFANIGPDGEIKHIPTFRDTAYFTELEAHEFGHPLLPIAGEQNSPFAQAIEETAYLFAPVAEVMDAYAYGAWDTVLEETILRACVVRIMEQVDPEHAAQLLQEELDKGFLYITSVYDSLGTYIENRTAYETLDDFLPEVFEKLLADFPPTDTE